MEREDLKNHFSGKKILVTGGTGFIGSRLIEKLIVEYNADVTAIVRNYSKAMRIARLSVKLVYGDITDKESILKASENADYIFHCAYGNVGTAEEKDTVNVKGTKNLLEAALAHKPQRLVYLSTLMVYGQPEVKVLNEETPKKKSKDQYSESKRIAEEIVFNYYQKYNLPVSVIQPTAVYGPWAPSYGIRIFNQMHTGKIAMVNSGVGVINLIYIDDLVQMMLLCAVKKEAIGEAFLAADNECPDYKNFYSYFEKIVGEERTVSLSAEDILKRSKKSFFKALKKAISIKVNFNEFIALMQYKPMKIITGLLKRLIPKPLLKKIKSKILPAPASSSIQKAVRPIILPNKDAVKFQLLTTRVFSSKEKKLLGFAPEYNLEKGFSEVEKWYKWYYNKN